MVENIVHLLIYVKVMVIKVMANELWDLINEKKEFDDFDLEIYGNVLMIEYIGDFNIEELSNILNILGDLGVAHKSLIYTNNDEFVIEVHCDEE